MEQKNNQLIEVEKWRRPMNLSCLYKRLEKAGRLRFYWEYEKRINPDWYYKPEGIHGVGHTRRVLLLSQVLSVLSGLEDHEQEFLAVISLLHDIGRTNDDVDPGHGVVSFRKAKDLGLIDQYKDFDAEMIKYVIEMHCVDDKRAFDQVGKYKTDTAEALKMLKFFKDSDGLDRVRIWDLDTNQLRTPTAKELVPLAVELCRNQDKVLAGIKGNGC